MVTQCEAIIEALEALGGCGTIKEVERWVIRRYGSHWKDFGTSMADMVPVSDGGNRSSLCPEKYRILKRASRGEYCLIKKRQPSGKSSEKFSQESTLRKVVRFQPLSLSSIPYEKKTSSGFVPDREFLISGNPATFATSGELPWKKVLQEVIPQCSLSLGEYGLTLDFQLADLAPQGQPLDVDNLCEPVFSILINKKGYFGGKRPNLFWWRASKHQSTSSGCRIRLFSKAPPIESLQDLVFDEYFPGPLPQNAKAPEMPAWIKKIAPNLKTNYDESYFVVLKFDNVKINIGEIATGVVKTTIDCLYPILGGSASSPEDWKIAILQVEKGANMSNGKGVHISISKLRD